MIGTDEIRNRNSFRIAKRRFFKTGNIAVHAEKIVPPFHLVIFLVFSAVIIL